MVSMALSPRFSPMHRDPFDVLHVQIPRRPTVLVIVGKGTSIGPQNHPRTRRSSARRYKTHRPSLRLRLTLQKKPSFGQLLIELDCGQPGRVDEHDLFGDQIPVGRLVLDWLCNSRSLIEGRFNGFLVQREVRATQDDRSDRFRRSAPPVILDKGRGVVADVVVDGVQTPRQRGRPVRRGARQDRRRIPEINDRSIRAAGLSAAGPR